MVEKTVEHRAHSGGVTQQLAPVFDGTIRSQQCAGPFIASHDDLEQFFGSRQGQLAHPEIVDDTRHVRKFRNSSATIVPTDIEWERKSILQPKTASE